MNVQNWASSEAIFTKHAGGKFGREEVEEEIKNLQWRANLLLHGTKQASARGLGAGGGALVSVGWKFIKDLSGQPRSDEAIKK